MCRVVLASAVALLGAGCGVADVHGPAVTTLGTPAAVKTGSPKRATTPVNAAERACTSLLASSPHLPLGRYTMRCVSHLSADGSTVAGTGAQVAAMTYPGSFEVLVLAGQPDWAMSMAAAHESAHAWMFQHPSAQSALAAWAGTSNIFAGDVYADIPSEVFAGAYARCVTGRTDRFVHDSKMSCTTMNSILDAG